MQLFTKTEEIIDLGMTLIRILAFGYITMGILQCLSGVMRGTL